MRRRQTRVPNTAQPSLSFGDAPPAHDGRTKVRFGATQFVEATPWHLFVGGERLDAYLKGHGLDWIVRLREELQKVDFSPLELNYQGTGRPPYHPRMIMGLIVYGVLKRKSSLREIEELAVADVGAWWICGGQQPDHSTIGDFLVRHQEEIKEEYFNRLVRDLVGRKGITAGVVAGDGTVIEASASRYAMLTQEAAEKAATKAREAAERDPNDDDLASKARHSEQVAQVAAERVEQKKRKGRTQSEHSAVVAAQEPEAVVQRCKDGRRRAAYLPSILVHESGLIVAQALDPSHEAAVVGSMLDQHQAVFGANPRAALFDANYFTHQVLGEALARSIDILCPSGTSHDEQWQRRGAKGKFGKCQFQYEEQSDRYLCPAGQWLQASKRYRDRNSGQMARKYQTKQCASCELRAQCTQSTTGRSIVRFDGDEIKEAMEQVMGQGRARALYRLRGEIVERVFAEIGWRQGLRRFRRRGRIGAALEFSLHCIAHNLKWATNHGPFGSLGALITHFWRSWRLLLQSWPQPAPTKWERLEIALFAIG